MQRESESSDNDEYRNYLCDKRRQIHNETINRIRHNPNRQQLRTSNIDLEKVSQCILKYNLDNENKTRTPKSFIDDVAKLVEDLPSEQAKVNVFVLRLICPRSRTQNWKE